MPLYAQFLELLASEEPNDLHIFCQRLEPDTIWAIPGCDMDAMAVFGCSGA